jgi:hypothetical protein
MFPRMRQRLGSALRDNLDLLVEFSTLGEYRLDAPDGQAHPRAPGTSTAPAEPATLLPLPSGRRTCGRPSTAAAKRQRAGAPAPREQACTAA